MRFYDEVALRRTSGGRMAVDFLVPFSDANVMFESKAVELSPHARVSPDISVVNNHLRSSVVKAIKQGLTSANWLQRTSLDGVDSSAECLLIIVTFKELNVGPGRIFVDGEIQNELDDFAAREGLDRGLLPEENIYFLDVGEFEWLMGVSKQRGREISTIVRAAIEADRRPDTQKFYFSQHLIEQFGSFRSPLFATDPFDELWAGVAQRLGTDPATLLRRG